MVKSHYLQWTCITSPVYKFRMQGHQGNGQLNGLMVYNVLDVLTSLVSIYGAHFIVSTSGTFGVIERKLHWKKGNKAGNPMGNDIMIVGNATLMITSS